MDKLEKMVRNKNNTRAHQGTKDTWDTMKVSGGVPYYIGLKGNTYEQVSNMVPMEAIPIVCNCIQTRNHNSIWPDNPCRLCSIKCTDPDTGNVYAFDEIYKEITCPSEIYKYSALFEVS